jgi:hypothetical protein
MSILKSPAREQKCPGLMFNCNQLSKLRFAPRVQAPDVEDTWPVIPVPGKTLKEAVYAPEPGPVCDLHGQRRVRS